MNLKEIVLKFDPENKNGNFVPSVFHIERERGLFILNLIESECEKISEKIVDGFISGLARDIACGNDKNIFKLNSHLQINVAKTVIERLEILEEPELTPNEYLFLFYALGSQGELIKYEIMKIIQAMKDSGLIVNKEEND